MANGHIKLATTSHIVNNNNRNDNGQKQMDHSPEPSQAQFKRRRRRGRRRVGVTPGSPVHCYYLNRLDEMYGVVIKDEKVIGNGSGAKNNSYKNSASHLLSFDTANMTMTNKTISSSQVVDTTKLLLHNRQDIKGYWNRTVVIFSVLLVVVIMATMVTSGIGQTQAHSFNRQQFAETNESFQWRKPLQLEATGGQKQVIGPKPSPLKNPTGFSGTTIMEIPDSSGSLKNNKHKEERIIIRSSSSSTKDNSQLLVEVRDSSRPLGSTSVSQGPSMINGATTAAAAATTTIGRGSWLPDFPLRFAASQQDDNQEQRGDRSKGRMRRMLSQKQQRDILELRRLPTELQRDDPGNREISGKGSGSGHKMKLIDTPNNRETTTTKRQQLVREARNVDQPTMVGNPLLINEEPNKQIQGIRVTTFSTASGNQQQPQQQQLSRPLKRLQNDENNANTELSEEVSASLPPTSPSTAEVAIDSENLHEQDFEKRLKDWNQKYEANRAISDRAYYILLIIYSLFILIGAVCNSLICLTVILKPKILSPRNIFIVNLAGSDLLLCVFTMPFSFIEISMKMWQMGLIPCKLVAGLQATSIFVSTISITAIALDRYKVIVYPTHQETHGSTRRAALLLASVWFGALLLSLPLFQFRTVQHVNIELPFVAHKYGTSIKSVDFCIEDWPLTHGRGIYSVISMIFQYVLPITIVSVVYAKISDKLQKRLIRRQRLTQLECQQKKQLNLIRRTHTMLISVSLIFGLSWLPLNLLNVIGDFTDLFKGDDQLFRIVFAICHLIGCSSACSNPILYGYLNENFRKEFHQVYTHHVRKFMRFCGRTSSGSAYLPPNASSTGNSSSSANQETQDPNDSDDEDDDDDDDDDDGDSYDDETDDDSIIDGSDEDEFSDDDDDREPSPFNKPPSCTPNCRPQSNCLSLVASTAPNNVAQNGQRCNSALASLVGDNYANFGGERRGLEKQLAGARHSTSCLHLFPLLAISSNSHSSGGNQTVARSQQNSKLERNKQINCTTTDKDDNSYNNNNNNGQAQDTAAEEERGHEEEEDGEHVTRTTMDINSKTTTTTCAATPRPTSCVLEVGGSRGQDGSSLFELGDTSSAIVGLRAGDDEMAAATRRCSFQTTASSGRQPLGLTMKFCLCLSGTSSTETLGGGNQLQKKQQQQKLRHHLASSTTKQSLPRKPDNSPLNHHHQKRQHRQKQQLALTANNKADQEKEERENNRLSDGKRPSIRVEQLYLVDVAANRRQQTMDGAGGDGDGLKLDATVEHKRRRQRRRKGSFKQASGQEPCQCHCHHGHLASSSLPADGAKGTQQRGRPRCQTKKAGSPTANTASGDRRSPSNRIQLSDGPATLAGQQQPLAANQSDGQSKPAGRRVWLRFLPASRGDRSVELASNATGNGQADHHHHHHLPTVNQKASDHSSSSFRRGSGIRDSLRAKARSLLLSSSPFSPASSQRRQSSKSPDSALANPSVLSSDQPRPGSKRRRHSSSRVGSARATGGNPGDPKQQHPRQVLATTDKNKTSPTLNAIKTPPSSFRRRRRSSRQQVQAARGSQLCEHCTLNNCKQSQTGGDPNLQPRKRSRQQQQQQAVDDSTRGPPEGSRASRRRVSAAAAAAAAACKRAPHKGGNGGAIEGLEMEMACLTGSTSASGELKDAACKQFACYLSIETARSDREKRDSACSKEQSTSVFVLGPSDLEESAGSGSGGSLTSPPPPPPPQTPQAITDSRGDADASADNKDVNCPKRPHQIALAQDINHNEANGMDKINNKRSLASATTDDYAENNNINSHGKQHHRQFQAANSMQISPTVIGQGKEKVNSINVASTKFLPPDVDKARILCNQAAGNCLRPLPTKCNAVIPTALSSTLEKNNNDHGDRDRDRDACHVNGISVLAMNGNSGGDGDDDMRTTITVANSGSHNAPISRLALKQQQQQQQQHDMMMRDHKQAQTTAGKNRHLSCDQVVERLPNQQQQQLASSNSFIATSSCSNSGSSGSSSPARGSNEALTTGSLSTVRMTTKKTTTGLVLAGCDEQVACLAGQPDKLPLVSGGQEVHGLAEGEGEGGLGVGIGIGVGVGCSSRSSEFVCLRSHLSASSGSSASCTCSSLGSSTASSSCQLNSASNQTTHSIRSPTICSSIASLAGSILHLPTAANNSTRPPEAATCGCLLYHENYE